MDCLTLFYWTNVHKKGKVGQLCQKSVSWDHRIPACCLLLGQAEPSESREAFPIISIPGFGSRQGGKSRQLMSWAMAD